MQVHVHEAMGAQEPSYCRVQRCGLKDVWRASPACASVLTPGPKPPLGGGWVLLPASLARGPRGRKMAGWDRGTT